MLKVPVTVEIAVGALLNRDELTHNAPTNRLVYIYKRETGGPEASSAILLRDLLNRGYSKFKLCKYEESRKLFEEAVALDPRSVEAHAWLRFMAVRSKPFGLFLISLTIFFWISDMCLTSFRKSGFPRR